MVDWPIEVDAIYEGGVLKPERPLPLKEGTRVRVSIEIKAEDMAATNGVEDSSE